MSSATWALQAAIQARLMADAELIEELGGQKIYDSVPPGRPDPYVTFGPLVARDWSTGEQSGQEHELSLHVWSRSHGRGPSVQIAERVRDLLHDQAVSVEGHDLINLRHIFTEFRREADGKAWRGLVRFRAVTTPISN